VKQASLATPAAVLHALRTLSAPKTRCPRSLVPRTRPPWASYQQPTSLSARATQAFIAMRPSASGVARAGRSLRVKDGRLWRVRRTRLHRGAQQSSLSVCVTPASKAACLLSKLRRTTAQFASPAMHRRSAAEACRHSVPGEPRTSTFAACVHPGATVRAAWRHALDRRSLHVSALAARTTTGVTTTHARPVRRTKRPLKTAPAGASADVPTDSTGTLSALALCVRCTTSARTRRCVPCRSTTRISARSPRGQRTCATLCASPACSGPRARTCASYVPAISSARSLASRCPTWFAVQKTSLRTNPARLPRRLRVSRGLPPSRQRRGSALSPVRHRGAMPGRTDRLWRSSVTSRTKSRRPTTSPVCAKQASAS
jgi:hypothetical protein